MEISIEKLNHFEVDEFCKVFYSTLETEFPGYKPEVIEYFKTKAYTPVNFRYWITENLKTILVAKDKDTIVGFSVIDSRYGGVSLCRWLGVIPQYQKKGIGSKLIEAWKLIAVQEKCHKIELAAQPTAKEFYEKIGLHLEGKRLLSYFGIDQYIFGNVIGEPQPDSMV